MRLNVRHFNVRSIDRLDAWVERQIIALGTERQIDEANIRLARLADASPAFEVTAHLVTPGPDLFAEARDHTLRAAFTKALVQLRGKMAGRIAKRMRRAESNLSAPAEKSRPAKLRLNR